MVVQNSKGTQATKISLNFHFVFFVPFRYGRRPVGFPAKTGFTLRPSGLVRVSKTQMSEDEIGNRSGVPKSSRTSIRQLTVNFVSQLTRASKCNDLPRFKGHVLTG